MARELSVVDHRAVDADGLLLSPSPRRSNERADQPELASNPTVLFQVARVNPTVGMQITATREFCTCSHVPLMWAESEVRNATSWGVGATAGWGFSLPHPTARHATADVVNTHTPACRTIRTPSPRVRQRIALLIPGRTTRSIGKQHPPPGDGTVSIDALRNGR